MQMRDGRRHGDAHAARRGFDKPILALTAHPPRVRKTVPRRRCSDYVPSRSMPTVCSRRSPTRPERARSTHRAAVAKRAFDRPSDSSGGIQSTLPTEDQDFAEVVDEFVDRLHHQLGAMQSAWEERELDELASLAHWLKGSGGTAGFDAFTRPARRLEELAKGNRLDEIESAIDELQQLASQVVTPSQQSRTAS